MFARAMISAFALLTSGCALVHAASSNTTTHTNTLSRAPKSSSSSSTSTTSNSAFISTPHTGTSHPPLTLGLAAYIANGLGLSQDQQVSSAKDTASSTPDAVTPGSKSNATFQLPSVTAIHTIVHTSITSDGAVVQGDSISASRSIVHPQSSNITSKHPGAAFASFPTRPLGTAPYGPSNSTNRTTSLASTGSGYDYANACNQALYSWSSKYVTYNYSDCTSSPAASSAPSPTLPVAGADEIFTTCDGIPRVLDNYTTEAVPITYHCREHDTVSGAPPIPTCSIHPVDCSSLMSSFSSHYDVPTNVGIVVHGYMTSLYKDYPRCDTNTIKCVTGSLVPSADCGINGDGIELMYWPQTWMDGFCGQSREFATLGPTIAGQPNTIVSDDYTFTSPTVYIKYKAISASDRCSNLIGEPLTSGYIPLPSTDVSTKLPWFWTNIPWEGPSGMVNIARSIGIQNARTMGFPGLNPDYVDQFVPLNYPDLNEPIPAEAYYAYRIKAMDLNCWSGGCPTMLPWQNKPALKCPDQVRSLRSEWLSCTLPWGGLNDPPSALVPATSIQTPTIPSPKPIPSTSAEPCSTPKPYGPSPTHSESASPVPFSYQPAPSTGSPRPNSRPNNQPGSFAGSTSNLPSANLGAAACSLLKASCPEHSPEDGHPEPNHKPQTGPRPFSRPALDSPDLANPGASTVDQPGHGSMPQSYQPEKAQSHDAPRVVPFSTNSQGQTVVQAGQATLTLGGSDATTEGVIISAGSQGVVAKQADITTSLEDGIVAIPSGQGANTAFATRTALTNGRTGYVVGSQTLTAGGKPAIISGTSYSAGPQGIVAQSRDAVQFTGSTADIPIDSGYAPVATRTTLSGGTTAALITEGSQTYTVAQGAGPTTIDGQVLQYDASQGLQVIHPTATYGVTTSAGFLILGSQTYLAQQTTAAGGKLEIIIAAHPPQTLELKGQPATIDGRVVSYGDDGLVVEGAKTTFGYASPSTTPTLTQQGEAPESVVQAGVTHAKSTTTTSEAASLDVRWRFVMYWLMIAAFLAR